jgi:uncharacterized OsmC-like protein
LKTEDLRALQTPLKERYREDAASAVVTLRASGRIAPETVTCKVATGRALVEAGLHPATGGSGLALCSGDMLLEALVACAGVTCGAVASALGIEIEDGTIVGEGDVDFRGTLAVSKDAPVGFRGIRLTFQLVTGAPADQVAKLIELTERYCVVYQTLIKSPAVTVNHTVVPTGASPRGTPA